MTGKRHADGQAWKRSGGPIPNNKADRMPKHPVRSGEHSYSLEDDLGGIGNDHELLTGGDAPQNQEILRAPVSFICLGG